MQTPLVKAGILAAVTLGLLTACVGIHIGEARVFQPQPVDNKAASVDEMHIEFQEMFERPSNILFELGINKDEATIRIPQDEFISADLQHGYWADGTIAVTEITRQFDGVTPAHRPLVVHCGGNASDRYNSGALFGLKVLPYADLIVLDYPGYGDSPGSPSADSFQQMVTNLADELNSRQVVNDRPLILWGYSLGGFVCAELATAVDQVDAVIIESSARDARRASRQLVPALLRPFVRVHLSPTLADFDNVRALQNYAGPVLVLAGAEDSILPAKLSRSLVQGLRQEGANVEYHEFAGGNHVNLPSLKPYQETLREFFSRWDAEI